LRFFIFVLWQVFAFADAHRGAYSGSLRAAVCPCYCDYSGYQDELLWGAAWLHRASRRREYREYIKRNEVALGASDAINEFGWDNKHAGINVLISKVTVTAVRGFYHPSPMFSSMLHQTIARHCITLGTLLTRVETLACTFWVQKWPRIARR
jgi:hypothetical protein